MFEFRAKSVHKVSKNCRSTDCTSGQSSVPFAEGCEQWFTSAAVPSQKVQPLFSMKRNRFPVMLKFAFEEFKQNFYRHENLPARNSKIEMSQIGSSLILAT